MKLLDFFLLLKCVIFPHPFPPPKKHLIYLFSANIEYVLLHDEDAKCGMESFVKMSYLAFYNWVLALKPFNSILFTIYTNFIVVKYEFEFFVFGSCCCHIKSVLQKNYNFCQNPSL